MGWIKTVLLIVTLMVILLLIAGCSGKTNEIHNEDIVPISATLITSTDAESTDPVQTDLAVNDPADTDLVIAVRTDCVYALRPEGNGYCYSPAENIFLSSNLDDTVQWQSHLPADTGEIDVEQVIVSDLLLILLARNKQTGPAYTLLAYVHLGLFQWQSDILDVELGTRLLNSRGQKLRVLVNDNSLVLVGRYRYINSPVPSTGVFSASVSLLFSRWWNYREYGNATADATIKSVAKGLAIVGEDTFWLLDSSNLALSVLASKNDIGAAVFAHQQADLLVGHVSGWTSLNQLVHARSAADQLKGYLLQNFRMNTDDTLLDTINCPGGGTLIRTGLSIASVSDATLIARGCRLNGNEYSGSVSLYSQLTNTGSVYELEERFGYDRLVVEYADDSMLSATCELRKYHKQAGSASADPSGTFISL